MADLLSDSEWAEFRSAIGDLADTFFNQEITIRKKVENLKRFNYAGDSAEYQDFVLRCLAEEKGKNPSIEPSGTLEQGELKISLSWPDVVEAGLIEDGVVLLTPILDRVIFRGDRYRIKQINREGPMQTRYGLVVLIIEQDEQGV